MHRSITGAVLSPPALQVLPFVIGKKGATKQRIEQDTGARLHIPRKDPAAGPSSGSGSSSVTVRGDSRGSVARARTQLDLVVASALSRCGGARVGRCDKGWRVGWDGCVGLRGGRGQGFGARGRVQGAGKALGAL